MTDTQSATPPSPLRRLFDFARPYRRDARWAASFSVLNKIFDVLPELLIGMAVEVTWEEHEKLSIPLFRPVTG